MHNRHSIQRRRADEKRRPIRLGEFSDRRAKEMKRHIDELEFAVLNGQEPVASTKLWFTIIDIALHGRIAKAGLCQPKESGRLSPYMAEWIKLKASEVKPATVRWMRQAERVLVEWFGPDCGLRSITPDHVESWSRWMRFERARKLSEATARKRCVRWRVRPWIG